MTYLLLCVWVACILFAFVGYGRLVLWACDWPQTSFGLAGALGCSVLIAGGGLINLTGFIRAPLLIGLVAVGDLLALVFVRWQFRRLSLPVIAVAAFVAIPVLGNVHADVRSFNIYDDLPAYLTLPVETLQLGRLPADPFNERRVTSSLGAPYFLQAFVLPFGNVTSIRAVDVSIGWILYTTALFAVIRSLGLSIRAACAIIALTLIAPVYRINATFVVLPAALFTALFLVVLTPRPGLRRGLLLGLLVGAISTLKSNYIPPALAICGLYFAIEVFRAARATLLEFCAFAASVTAVVLPWMIDLKQAEGTYLFPVLGLGYDASAYGIMPLPSGVHHWINFANVWVWITAGAYSLPYLAALVLAATSIRKKVENGFTTALIAFLGGTTVAIPMLASSTGGESLGRYSLPFQVPALLIFCGFLLRWRRHWPQPRRAWTIGAMVACGSVLCLAALFGIAHGQYRTYLEDARVLTPRPDAWFDVNTERQRVQNLQKAVPPGQRILARLFVSFPFDFRRNPVLIADYPGMAGLMPGMPVDGPDTLRAYLLANGIRYLAFDYRRTRFPDDDPQTTLWETIRQPYLYGRHRWLYTQVKLANSEQRAFAALGRSRVHLFDDGTAFLLDLASERSYDGDRAQFERSQEMRSPGGSFRGPG